MPQVVRTSCCLVAVLAIATALGAQPVVHTQERGRRSSVTITVTGQVVGMPADSLTTASQEDARVVRSFQAAARTRPTTIRQKPSTGMNAGFWRILSGFASACWNL